MRKGRLPTLKFTPVFKIYSEKILMEKKKGNQEGYIILQEKLRKLESDYLATKEKLKVYGYKDSSENADWTTLSEKLVICQSQIDLLKTKMVEVSRENDKIITYRLVETGEEKTIQLTNGETDPDQGKISRVSPLGMALNEKKAGEIAEVKIGEKKYQVQILQIEEK
jgi:transcription elongation factor GreA